MNINWTAIYCKVLLFYLYVYFSSDVCMLLNNGMNQKLTEVLYMFIWRRPVNQTGRRIAALGGRAHLKSAWYKF